MGLAPRAAERLRSPVALYGADVAGDEPPFRAEGLMLSPLGTTDPATLRTWFSRLIGFEVDPES